MGAGWYVGAIINVVRAFLGRRGAWDVCSTALGVMGVVSPRVNFLHDTHPFPCLLALPFPMLPHSSFLYAEPLNTLSPIWPTNRESPLPFRPYAPSFLCPMQGASIAINLGTVRGRRRTHEARDAERGGCWGEEGRQLMGIKGMC